MEKFPADAISMIRTFYEALPGRVKNVRTLTSQPLTLAEKILFAHRADQDEALPTRGVTTVGLRPDRVAMQDATAQMAILQFMTASKSEVSIPTTDHWR